MSITLTLVKKKDHNMASTSEIGSSRTAVTDSAHESNSYFEQKSTVKSIDTVTETTTTKMKADVGPSTIGPIYMVGYLGSAILTKGKSFYFRYSGSIGIKLKWIRLFLQVKQAWAVFRVRWRTCTYISDKMPRAFLRRGDSLFHLMVFRCFIMSWAPKKLSTMTCPLSMTSSCWSSPTNDAKTRKSTAHSCPSVNGFQIVYS